MIHTFKDNFLKNKFFLFSSRFKIAAINVQNFGLAILFSIIKLRYQTQKLLMRYSFKQYGHFSQVFQRLKHFKFLIFEKAHNEKISNSMTHGYKLYRKIIPQTKYIYSDTSLNLMDSTFHIYKSINKIVYLVVKTIRQSREDITALFRRSQSASSGTGLNT